MSKAKIYSEEVISSLCKGIEHIIRRQLKTPQDFSYLSECISEQCGKSVSATTLKRIWGYNKDVGNRYRPYRYTMCVLASFLGYSDIEEYIASGINRTTQSAEYLGRTVCASDIAAGTQIHLWWSPGRECDLVALGDMQFRVVRSVAGRLKVGDIVVFVSITNNAPLYFNEVMRAGSDESFVYVAGLRSGVSFRIVSE